VGILDLKTGKFDYSYAAHEPYMLITTNEKSETVLTYCSSGPSNPLGAQMEPSFTVESIMLKPKDRLFFYTDGFFEMIDVHYNKKGPKRIKTMLKHALSSSAGASVMDIAANLDKQVYSSMERQTLVDDVTFFLMQYK